MAELTPQERLQPSLLDRLINDDPQARSESRDKRVLSLRQLREAVLRDLRWLFNATNLASVTDLSDYPEIEKTVLNYGMPALAGASLASVRSTDLERQLKQAILRFEPRIMPNSLKVRLNLSEDRSAHSAVTFDIEGELWAQPINERIFLRTEVDLELGDVQVIDLRG